MSMYFYYSVWPFWSEFRTWSEIGPLYQNVAKMSEKVRFFAILVRKSPIFCNICLRVRFFFENGPKKSEKMVRNIRAKYSDLIVGYKNLAVKRVFSAYFMRCFKNQRSIFDASPRTPRGNNYTISKARGWQSTL